MAVRELGGAPPIDGATTEAEEGGGAVEMTTEDVAEPAGAASGDGGERRSAPAPCTRLMGFTMKR